MEVTDDSMQACLSSKLYTCNHLVWQYFIQSSHAFLINHFTIVSNGRIDHDTVFRTALVIFFVKSDNEICNLEREKESD